MKPILIAGTSIVNLALVCYTIAIVQVYKFKKVHPGVLSFFTLGVIFDITATILMVLGSSKGILTLHGIIGYSSLLGMLYETITLWKLKQKNGINSGLSSKALKISYLVYSWWVIAYITGAVIVALRHAGK